MKRWLGRAWLGMGTAVVVMMVTAGVATASGAGCTDTWTNSAGGSWDTGTNWSAGHAPMSSDNACITASGTYTVVIGNETITVANLTMGGAGSSPTLQIGNGGSSTPAITVTGAITNNSGSTISYGWGGSFTAGSLSNAGTFEVPNTGFGATLKLGAVTNTGTFSVAGGATMSLTSGTTFDNASGGTISNSAGTLAIGTSGGPTATLELDSGGVVDNSGTIAAAETVAVDGGSICGNPLTVGSADGGTGGALQFSSTPGTGPACGTGVATDQIFIANVAATLSGTIPSAYTVVVGDGGSSYFALTLSGAVINDGRFEPGFGGTVSPASGGGSLTNNGTTEVPVSGYLTKLNVPIANDGQLTFNANTTATIPDGSAWTNASGATITVASNASLPLTSPSGTPTLVQQGVIDNLGAFNVGGTVNIEGGSICGHALGVGLSDGSPVAATLEFASKVVKGPACASGTASDQLFIYNINAVIASSTIPSGYTVTIGDGGSSFAHVSTPGNLTNSGTLAPQFGATLTVGGDLTNKGTISVVKNGYSTVIDANNVTNSKMIKIDGELTITPASGDEVTNTSTGSITVATTSVTFNSSLVNDGKLTIDAKDTLSLPVQGSTPSTYTQASTGTLLDPITTAAGVLSVSGSATLAGAVNLASGSDIPAYHKAYTFITAASTSGTFSSVTGPYTINYTPTSVQAIGQPTATLTLAPTSGAPGSAVTLTGYGYQAGEMVNVYLDSTTGTLLKTVKAASTGKITGSITIPTGTSTGSHHIITLGKTSNQSASAPFTVT